MGKHVKILCCCGAGICTSNYLKEEIEDRLKADGLNKEVSVQLCRVTDVDDALENGGIDFLVTTVQIDKTYPVPVIRALGIMLDEAAANKALDEIIQQVHLVQEKK